MRAVRLLLVCFLFLYTNTSFANLSDGRINEFNKVCVKFNANLKKVGKQCRCESANFKWLVDDSRWGVFLDLYNVKILDDKIRGDLQPLNTLIYSVAEKCHKKYTYRAAKVKALMRKK